MLHTRKPLWSIALAGSIGLLTVGTAHAGSLPLPSSNTLADDGVALWVKNTQNNLGSPHPRPTAIAGIGSGTNGTGVEGQASNTGYGGYFILSGANANSSSDALFAVNSGGGTTKGDHGSAGDFSVTNAKNESPGVSIATNGVNSYALKVVNTGTNDNTLSYGPPDDFGGIAGFFQVSSANAQFGQAAVYAVNSGGEVGAGHNGRYGGGGFFVITNTNNFDTALVGQTKSTQGTGVEGDDFSAGGGIAVVGQSTAGLSAQFTGGSGSTGTCSYDGSAGWTCPSDRNLKQHFVAVDLSAVLSRLDGIPMFTYEMKGAAEPTLYLGPTAQDFKAAFGLGKNDTTINTANAQGVALAAAKGLYEKLKADETRIAAQDTEIAALKQELADRMAKLERVVARLTPEKTLASLDE
jgi:hypothetical protein